MITVARLIVGSCIGFLIGRSFSNNDLPSIVVSLITAVAFIVFVALVYSCN